jgi:ATP-dependent Clp protease ATP-binding subunit ClpA
MRRREDNYLGTEHVLLGIGGNKVGTAVRILASIGVSPETLENLLYQLRRRATG